MLKANDQSRRRRARTRLALRRKAEGRSRLTVFRSGKQIYAQIIDDGQGRTLASASTLEKDMRGSLKSVPYQTIKPDPLGIVEVFS